MRKDRKILAIDDEPEVLAFVSEILRGAGYQTVTATNAGEAVFVCEEMKEELTLIVFDATMPGMSGMELAECVSTMLHPVPVVLMSGYSAEDLVERNGQRRSWRFVGKPFVPAALLQLVLQVLS